MSDDDADNVFDEFLEKIAKEIFDDEIVKFGLKLRFKSAQIDFFKDENKRTVTTKGTLKMLREWCQHQDETYRRGNLKAALEKAGIVRLVTKYFSADEMEQHPRHTTPASMVQGAGELTCTVTENSPVQLQSHVTETSEPPSVFISYQWDKQPEIMRLCSRLTDLGYHCWLDKQNIGGGDELSSEIVKGLTNAKVIISCLTPKYALSEMCRKEMSLSMDLKKPIIPLLLENMPWPPKGPMAFVFTNVLYIDCTNASTQAKIEDEKFKGLIKMINKYTQPMIEIMPATEERNVDEHLQTATPQAGVSEQLQASASSS